MIGRRDAADVPVRTVADACGFASIAGLCALVAGCAATPAPLSNVVLVGSRLHGSSESFREGLRIDGGRSDVVDAHLVAVDGRRTSTSAIAPGEHAVTISVTSTNDGRVPIVKTYRIVVEPCRSHYFRAEWQPAPRFGALPDWDLIPVQVYAVPGCDPAREVARASDVSFGADARADVVATTMPSDSARRPRP